MPEKSRLTIELVKEFYERETGLSADQAPGRVLSIFEFLSREGLGLEDVELVRNSDPAWSSRANRTPREQRAHRVGMSPKGPNRTNEVWWVVPREEPRA